MTGKYDRRNFLKAGATISAGLAFGKTFAAGAEEIIRRQGLSALPIVNQKPLEQVRIGFVGVGGRGSGLIRDLLKVEGAVIKAVCDIVPAKVEKIQKWVSEAGFETPTSYTKGERDFERLCENEELDLVMTATPWKWHVPVCVSAMKNGKHCAPEVPAAVTIEECWQLVETAEKYGKFCSMLENCCYDKFEMMMLNMTRKGLFGELVHGECGYMHDLRNIKLGTRGEALWRTEHSVNRDGNLYPTHGLGPVCQWMDINRGDKLNYLVSMSSNSRGLQEFAKEKLGPKSQWKDKEFKLGDVNTSLIKTANGKTIVLGHDTNLPRPYSRHFVIQGTKGIARKYPTELIHIDGKTKRHKWEPADSFYDQYGSKKWKEMEAQNITGGHGGMDFVMQDRLIQALRKGLAPAIDVYDTALWSAVAEVTEKSVAKGSAPVEIPDFTRGAWKNTKPLTQL